MAERLLKLDPSVVLHLEQLLRQTTDAEKRQTRSSDSHRISDHSLVFLRYFAN